MASTAHTNGFAKHLHPQVLSALHRATEEDDIRKVMKVIERYPTGADRVRAALQTTNLGLLCNHIAMSIHLGRSRLSAQQWERSIHAHSRTNMPARPMPVPVYVSVWGNSQAMSVLAYTHADYTDFLRLSFQLW